MTAEEITQIIDLELNVESDITNVFGLDLIKCLIEPIKQIYINDGDNSQTDELWTVLEESSDNSGYKIFFDDKIKMFGLGVKSNNDELVNIGYYGTFLKTLYSM